jgi:acyl-CoA synthetase (NDP forming)
MYYTLIQHGMRLVGPNVSGIINLHDNLLTHPAERAYLCKTPITFICQGAYAITDLAAREVSARRGFGTFLYTGNEASVHRGSAFSASPR